MSTLSIRSLSPLALGAGLVLSLGASGCCMGGGSSAPVAPLPSLAPVTAPVAPAPVVAGTQTLTLGAGFAPDPTVVATVAGGPISASTMSTGDSYCAGQIGSAPNVMLTTTSPMHLRVLARSTEDTTLAVRLSDGRVLCNDDGGGYPNPLVEADFPPGVHQVFVGSFHMGDTPAATLGFTVNPMLQNTQLP